MFWEFEKFNFSTTVYFLDTEEMRECISFLGVIWDVSWL
jgi:hypothetical protein